jgi:hypothetical protein
MKKTNTIFLIVALCALTMFTSKSYGQYNDGNNRADSQVDSIQLLKDEQSATKANDEVRMRDAKRDRKSTKAKAKEADRIGREANDAAKQSNNAFKAERKAQKTRKQADKQALKASKSRTKSDQN